MPFLRTAKEQPTAPLHGFKLAYPMVSADGLRGGFSGITIGRSSVYGVTADATCAQGARHRSPSRWCDCGFYCMHSIDDARALSCDQDYRYAVILEVVASGRFIRYERGLRYAHQRITAVRAGRCGCGRPAAMFTETAAGLVGWRRLMGACLSCAGHRPAIRLSEFARMLGGPPVTPDDIAQPYRCAEPHAPAAAPGAVAGSALEEADRAAMVPLLSAEVALLQARLDEVQEQLARLTASD
ncbi:MAG TPA: hypothetical protein VE733_24575 [Streptosporangiaceae bacterium]|jgi:hypothetical protein|nr:hypothetical protein [Streptosporangiaceae bacterium]